MCVLRKHCYSKIGAFVVTRDGRGVERGGSPFANKVRERKRMQNEWPDVWRAKGSTNKKGAGDLFTSRDHVSFNRDRDRASAGARDVRDHSSFSERACLAHHCNRTETRAWTPGVVAADSDPLPPTAPSTDAARSRAHLLIGSVWLDYSTSPSRHPAASPLLIPCPSRGVPMIRSFSRSSR